MRIISIIIPTTRPENHSLESFFKFNIPEGYNLEYVFIVDNPTKNLEDLIKLVKKYQNLQVKIIKNERNLGASASRNKGIEIANGDFILFLDDDCIVKPNLLTEYIKAYQKYPDHPGYVGITNTPNPKSSFDNAIELSDMLHFFRIAKLKIVFYWGITANLFIKREAIDNIRFPLNYPKKGGGEDIYFCLKIIRNYNKKYREIIKNDSSKQPSENRLFKCVSTAEVIHPFWKENLKSYLRYFRWGYGDVNLHKNFPQYCFHQYPNFIEYLFLIIFFNIIIWFIAPIINLSWSLNQLISMVLINTSAMVFWEHYCEGKKLKKQKRSYSFKSLFKAVLIRQLNDWGRFIHQLPMIWRISKRWDYFCTGESIKYERINAAKKFYGYITFTFISLVITILLI